MARGVVLTGDEQFISRSSLEDVEAQDLMWLNADKCSFNRRWKRVLTWLVRPEPHQAHSMGGKRNEVPIIGTSGPPASRISCVIWGVHRGCSGSSTMKREKKIETVHAVAYWTRL